MLASKPKDLRVDLTMTMISPEEVTVAPHVKVLGDEVSEQVKLVDPEGGSVRLVDEEVSYPTLRVGDVVIGADGLVPPMKVLGIAHEEGELILEVLHSRDLRSWVWRWNIPAI